MAIILTDNSKIILDLIAKSEPIRQVDLGKEARMSGTTILIEIGRIKALRLIDMEHKTGEGKSQTITLTPKGRKLQQLLND